MRGSTGRLRRRHGGIANGSASIIGASGSRVQACRGARQRFGEASGIGRGIGGGFGQARGVRLRTGGYRCISGGSTWDGNREGREFERQPDEWR